MGSSANPTCHPPRPGRLGRAVPWVLAALFLAQALHGLAVKTGTCDELGAHIPAGILLWKTGGASSGLNNPPLGQRMLGLGPVLTGTADAPLNDSPGHLLPARLPVLLLGVLTLLGTAAVARRAFGTSAGLLAMACAALSPNLIAHSRLATLDLPATASTLLACLLAWRAAARPSTWRLVAFAAAVGVAACTKHTALHLLPAISLGALLVPGAIQERIRRTLVLGGAAVAGVLAVAWFVHPHSFGAGALPEPMATKPVARVLTAALPDAFARGILGKWEHGASGHFSYLFGARSTDGFPHYFLVAVLLKTPGAILILAAAGLAALLGPCRDRAGFLAFVLLPAAWIFVAMSLLHRIDIGYRHILPALPAILALAGAGAARLGSGGRGQRCALVLLFGWLTLGAVRVTPDHLAYFNELAGGPARGDRALIDSNLDWGQDEGRFRAWAKERGVRVNPERPTDGVVAANINALHSILSFDDRPLRWLRRLSPRESIGHTWRIYDVCADDLRAVSAEDPSAGLDFARWLTATRSPEEAVTVLDALPEETLRSPAASRERAEALLAMGQLRDAASEAAGLALDPLLAAEVRYRNASLEGIAWNARSAQDQVGAFVALSRRGHAGEARDLALQLLAEADQAVARTGLALALAMLDDLESLGRLLPPPAAGSPRGPEELLRGPADALPLPERFARIRLLRKFGNERQALAETGAFLAVAPTHEEALWLYGELVVRRKLGLTEYALPSVDWSGVRH